MDKRVSSTLQRSPRTRALVEGALGAVGSSVETLPERWTSKQWAGMLDGWGESIALRWERRWGRSVKRVEEQRDWFGIRGILSGWNSPLSWVSAEAQCDTCGGGRLRREVLAVQLGGLGIHSLLGLSIERALAWARALSFVGEKQEVAKQPLMNLIRRLEFLVDTGVGYLALDRAAGSLSGGEAQRIRLASQLGSSLAGVIYVLDEPTIGLHPADTERLLSTLKGLRDNGNTIVVVEHDVETMLAADCLIDLGPGGGQHGGQVIGCGSPEAIQQHPSSLTGRWLSGKERMPSRADRRQASGNMVLHGARTNNLRGENVTIPMGCWTGIAGVSGSGKSSLVMDTLVPAIQAELGKEGAIGEWDALSTGVPIKRAVVVTQAPIGRTPRSTPATVCGVMDPLRRLYASTLGAKERGWGPGRFSFNGSKGRCSVCEGRGVLLIEMHFLPDVWTTCSACKGRRYNRETLEIRWKGHTIADVLTMRVEEALALFSNHRRLAKPLQALVDVGLGYLALGQPATTLSGGEAQRVKLASELTSRRGHCVYVLDEPTTGLHLDDVRRLIDVLHALVDAGHTVVTIEHQVDLLQQVDHLIELGPGGGEEGGHVIATGTPEEVQKAATPTGMALASSHISLI